jgi:predicted metal-dependent hydrolase
MPVRRTVRFDLPAERIGNWHGQGAYATHFFNALSLMFPAGERFFMDSVSHYRNQVHDPVLQKQVRGFLGQEAAHTREHSDYNDLLEAMGMPAHKLDGRWRSVLDLCRRTFSPAIQLAMTVAFEHHTAMLSAMMLSDEQCIAGSVDGYAQMWIWHSLEETEHKSVSFDVWNTVMKPGISRYLIRVGVMLPVSILFWLAAFYCHVNLVVAARRRHDPAPTRGPQKAKLAWHLIKFLYEHRGVASSIALDWLHFFKPGFHPWDRDDRQLLARIDDLMAAVKASSDVDSSGVA